MRNIAPHRNTSKLRPVPIGRLRYIQGILRNRLGLPDDDMMAELRDIHGWGLSLEHMEAAAKCAAGTFGDYWDLMVADAQALRP